MDDKTTHIALKKLREEISTNKAALKLSLDNPLKASIMLDGLSTWSIQMKGLFVLEIN